MFCLCVFLKYRYITMETNYKNQNNIINIIVKCASNFLQHTVVGQMIRIHIYHL